MDVVDFFLGGGTLGVRSLGMLTRATRGINELIPTVKIETRHRVKGLFGNTFLSIYNRCGVVAPWRPEITRRCKFLRSFWKNEPLRENFQNSVPTKFIAKQDRRACCVTCVQIS